MVLKTIILNLTISSRCGQQTVIKESDILITSSCPERQTVIIRGVQYRKGDKRVIQKYI